MSRVLELVAPARLGPGFRRLLAATWTTNLGDGLALAAGPLLVASQTDDAFLVALAALLIWLPPLLFGLVAGAVTDRVDRRLVIVAVNSVRFVVLALLAVSIVADVVSITLVLVAMFLLGTVEVFSDNAAATLLPMLVHREDLTVGNARLTTGFVTFNQLLGPPLGAFLFAAGSASPFLAQAVLVAFGALLVSRIALPPHRDGSEPVGRMLHEIREGFSWVVHHRAMRTLVLTVLLFNVTFGAAWSVLVLYATDHLGLGAVGFGMVTTVFGVGGLAGTLCYGWLTRRISLGGLMRVGLLVETFTHLGLALATSAYVAFPIFFLFGVHCFVWGTTATTIRHRAVPSRLQGRVSSVNVMGSCGGLVVGAAIGGALAREWSVTTPFWFAFVGAALTVVLLWRQMRHVAHDEPAHLRGESASSG